MGACAASQGGLHSKNGADTVTYGGLVQQGFSGQSQDVLNIFTFCVHFDQSVTIVDGAALNHLETAHKSAIGCKINLVCKGNLNFSTTDQKQNVTALFGWMFYNPTTSRMHLSASPPRSVAAVHFIDHFRPEPDTRNSIRAVPGNPHLTAGSGVAGSLFHSA